MMTFVAKGEGECDTRQNLRENYQLMSDFTQNFPKVCLQFAVGAKTALRARRCERAVRAIGGAKAVLRRC